jgi:glycosyltransferase involved in cell wall biosynthesis
LEQLSVQLHSEDEIIVVADGPIEKAKEIAHGFPVRYFEHGPTHIWGNAQRNYGITRAEKTHLYFLDDDDESLSGALEAIRSAIKDRPNHINIFRIHHVGTIIWKEPVICIGNVSTQMLVIPNDEKVGKWPNEHMDPDSQYAGDYTFLKDCVSKRGEYLVSWCENVIAVHGNSAK